MPRRDPLATAVRSTRAETATRPHTTPSEA